MRDRLNERDYRRVADELGISVGMVRTAVQAYFSAIAGYARTLPLNNAKRIYDRKKFSQFEAVWNIPYIGRIGPLYSRYVKWRSNEAKHISQEPRSNYKSRILQEDIEKAAQAILAGEPMPKLHKTKAKDLYNRVWVVGHEHKRLARQVIPKTEEDV